MPQAKKEFIEIFVTCWQLSSRIAEVQQRLKLNGYDVKTEEIKLLASYLRANGVRLKQEFNAVVSKVMLEIASVKKLPELK